MAYFYLFTAVFMNAASSVFGKWFHKRCAGLQDTGSFYNFLQLTAVFLCWSILFFQNPSFELSVLPYSALFALFFLLGNIGIINALKIGPASLTTLFVSLSLILTTGWGFLFWGDDLSLPVLLGLIFVALSIYLCLKTKENEGKRVSLRWLVSVLFAIIGNAGCSVVQRTQQMHYEGEHGNMLMFFATGAAAVFCLFRYLFSDRKDAPTLLRKGGIWPVLSGICNVVLNFLVMLMTFTDLSPSLIYPCLGAGGLMVVTGCSVFLFRERLNKWQWLGLGIGVLSVTLLSI